MRSFRLGDTLDLNAIRQELDEYMDVLLGRVDPPIQKGAATLMEVAEAYHARAREIEFKMREMELEGLIMKNSRGYSFRTGPLQSFIELTRKAIDLGTRRITLDIEMARAREV